MLVDKLFLLVHLLLSFCLLSVLFVSLLVSFLLLLLFNICSGLFSSLFCFCFSFRLLCFLQFLLGLSLVLGRCSICTLGHGLCLGNLLFRILDSILSLRCFCL